MKQKPERKTEQKMDSADKKRKTEEKKQKPEEGQKTQEKPASDKQFILLEKELERTGIPMETVLSRYHISSMEQMTPDIYAKALNGLKKTKTKDAA